MSIGEGIRIISDGTDVTIQTSVDLPVISVSETLAPVELDGLTIKHELQGDETQAGGIVLTNASINIRNCVIQDSEGSSGISATGPGHVVLENTTVENNASYGLLLEGSATLSDCIIRSNGAGVHGEGFSQWAQAVMVNDAVFTNCRFEANGACDVGSVVSVSGVATFQDCIFVDNVGLCPPDFGVVRVEDGASVLLDGCTIANNRAFDEPITPTPVHGVELRSSSSFAEVRNCIVANNSGRAICGPIGTPLSSVPISETVMYGNGYLCGCLESEICVADSSWAQQPGSSVSVGQPAFCDVTNGDYTLFAYSLAAPGALFAEGAGAEPVSCTGADTVMVDTSVLDNSQSYFACPNGDASPLLRVDVNLDDATTRTIGAGELALGFISPPYKVYDNNGVLTGSVDAVGPWFVSDVQHGEFGGQGTGSARVFLNGFPIGDQFSLEVRSPDINNDGAVDIIDFGLFGPHFPSPPEAYGAEFDFNADGAIDLIDWTMFGEHYLHQASHDPLPTSPQLVQTAFEVALSLTEVVTGATDREFHVQVSLDNVSGLASAVLALSNEHEHIQFREWVTDADAGVPTVAAALERDGQKELFIGVRVPKNATVGPSVLLGTAVFDVVTQGEVGVVEDDFALRVGDVLLPGGVQGVAAGLTLIVNSVPEVRVTQLAQNYPNPFNPQTTISYSLAERSAASLRIYSVTGGLVRILTDEVQSPNRYQVVWDGRDDRGSSVASGVYFYRLKAGSFSSTKKMVLIR